MTSSALASQPIADPLAPAANHQSPEWNTFLRSVHLLSRRQDRPSSEPLEAFRSRYTAERLQDQETFFRRKAAQASRVNRRLQIVANVATNLAPGLVLLALLIKCADYAATQPAWAAQVPWVKVIRAHLEGDGQGPLSPAGWILSICKTFLPAAVPLLAGVASSLRGSLDSVRRSVRYPEMATQLATIQASFHLLHTETSLHQAVIKTEETLLDELAEWKLAANLSGH